MKLCSAGVLHAVYWPGAAIVGEVFGCGRVPIAGFVHRFAAVEKLFDLLIQRRNDVVAVRDGECAARTEVVLDVNND